MGFLAELGAVLASSLEYRATLRGVAQLAVPALADHCVVDLVEGEKLERVEVALADRTARTLRERVKAFRVDRNSSHPAAVAIRTGKPVLVPEVTDAWLADHSASSAHLRFLRELGVRSILCAPLSARGQILGAITLGLSASGRSFAAADQVLMEEIGRRAGLAIDNARLYRNAQEAVRAREEVLGTVSHQLRNPLQAILLRTGLLLDNPSGPWREPERQALTAVHHSAEQMVRLADDLLDAAQIDGGYFTVRVGAEHPDAILAEAAEMIRPLAESRSLSLSVGGSSDLPTLLADRRRIVQLLGILVGDAVEHAEPGGIITVVAELTGRDVRFRVWNPTRKIPDRELPRLFEREWDTKRVGRGLGFVIARGIADAHGGRIRSGHGNWEMGYGLRRQATSEAPR